MLIDFKSFDLSSSSFTFEVKIYNASLTRRSAMNVTMTQNTTPMLVMREKDLYPTSESESFFSTLSFRRDFKPKTSHVRI